MGEGMMFTTSSNTTNLSILKVSIPKEIYDKEKDKVYKTVKSQVDNEYLVVVVPEGVELEIIV